MKRFLTENWKAMALVALAFGCITLGVFRGEEETVLRKAVNICMECIGLG